MHADGAPSMAGKNVGLHALVQKLAPCTIRTLCVIHKKTLVLIVFEVFLSVVNFIKNIPLRGRLFAKLCHDMGSEY